MEEKRLRVDENDGREGREWEVIPEKPDTFFGLKSRTLVTEVMRSPPLQVHRGWRVFYPSIWGVLMHSEGGVYGSK